MIDYTGLVIVAADPFPSDILRFAAQGAEGIVHLGGSATAHVAILQQLRAILRSREDGELRIMFPLVSSVDDFLQTKKVVELVREQLVEEGIPHCNHIEIGAMIELPSAVEIVEELAKESDFLSIGTNDLVQYMLAVDRSNTLVSDLYIPYHPAVLRVLKRIVDAAERQHIEVAVCGEMGSDVRLLPFLMGIGIRTISVNPEAFPQVKVCISQIDTQEEQARANKLLSLGRIIDVETQLRQVP